MTELETIREQRDKLLAALKIASYSGRDWADVEACPVCFVRRDRPHASGCDIGDPIFIIEAQIAGESTFHFPAEDLYAIGNPIEFEEDGKWIFGNVMIQPKDSSRSAIVPHRWRKYQPTRTTEEV